MEKSSVPSFFSTGRHGLLENPRGARWSAGLPGTGLAPRNITDLEAACGQPPSGARRAPPANISTTEFGNVQVVIRPQPLQVLHNSISWLNKGRSPKSPTTLLERGVITLYECPPHGEVHFRIRAPAISCQRAPRAHRFQLVSRRFVYCPPAFHGYKLPPCRPEAALSKGPVPGSHGLPVVGVCVSKAIEIELGGPASVNAAAAATTEFPGSAWARRAAHRSHRPPHPPGVGRLAFPPLSGWERPALMPLVSCVVEVNREPHFLLPQHR